MNILLSMNNDRIKQLIQKNNISWIQIHFTDLFGGLRILHIPSKRFLKDQVLKYGSGFDGFSVGLTNVENSDLISIPDEKTFLVLPHEKNEARIFADIYNTNRIPFDIDPRYTLKKAVNIVKKHGFDSIRISPEMEFFVLPQHRGENYEINNSGGYLSPPPIDNAKEYRRKISDLLLQSNYSIKYHHHENAKYQHEVEIKSLEAIDAADFCIYFKYLAREIANRENLQVTFMPKPFTHEAGNGMHAHISLNNNEKNMFFDKKNKFNLSKTARYFIGGIMEHAKGLAAITNPTVNSYKRLMPNYEAPIYIAWAQHNRSSLLRIAAKKNVDVEIRNADPSSNPYLFFSAVIYSGLDGIKNKIEYKPIEKNIYTMSKNELKKNDINKLPTNLFEALEEFEKDDVLKKAIGKRLSEIYIRKKKEEFQKYMSEVTNLDYNFYYNC